MQRTFIQLSLLLTMGFWTAFASAADWSGAYAGGALSLGYSASNMRYQMFQPGNAYVDAMNAWGNQTPVGSGPGLGLDGGYNFQRGAWIFGGEATADYVDLRGVDKNVFEDEGFATVTMRNSFNAGWLATVRPQFGYAIGEKSKIQVAAGLAMATVNMESSFHDSENEFEYGALTKLIYGWCASLGYAYQITPHWSARLDYQYADFNPLNVGEDNGSDSAYYADQMHHLLYLNIETLRLGVDYHF
jgi:opacity protein-like surface antigen